MSNTINHGESQTLQQKPGSAITIHASDHHTKVVLGFSDGSLVTATLPTNGKLEITTGTETVDISFHEADVDYTIRAVDENFEA